MRIIGTLVVLSALCVVPASAAPILSVSPTLTTVDAGSTFAAEIRISGAADLYAFQFDVGFNQDVVLANSVVEGAFLAGAGSTFFIPGAINNQGGAVTFTTSTLLGEIAGTNGSGLLATLFFTAARTGTSDITVSNVTLLDSALSDIAATTANGSVTVRGVPEPGTWMLLLVAVLGLMWRGVSPARSRRQGIVW